MFNLRRVSVLAIAQAAHVGLLVEQVAHFALAVTALMLRKELTLGLTGACGAYCDMGTCTWGKPLDQGAGVSKQPRSSRCSCKTRRDLKRRSGESRSDGLIVTGSCIAGSFVDSGFCGVTTLLFCKSLQFASLAYDSMSAWQI